MGLLTLCVCLGHSIEYQNCLERIGAGTSLPKGLISALINPKLVGKVSIIANTVALSGIPRGEVRECCMLLKLPRRQYGTLKKRQWSANLAVMDAKLGVLVAKLDVWGAGWAVFGGLLAPFGVFWMSFGSLGESSGEPGES